MIEALGPVQSGSGVFFYGEMIKKDVNLILSPFERLCRNGGQERVVISPLLLIAKTSLDG